MFIGSNTTYNIIEGELALSLANPYGAKLLARKIQGTTVELALSVASRRSASATGDFMVRLWDLAMGALLQTLQHYSGAIYAVAFSPDGKLLASASHDQTVRFWDLVTRDSLQTLEGHSGLAYVVAFSPDGKLLVSASGDYTIRL
jgi:WD40 repeat protein